MRVTRRCLPSLAALTLALAAAGCQGRGDAAIPKSQQARLEQRVGPVLVTIDYRRPVARGRRLFGGIVPYGKEWDPGADAATTIKFSGEVLLEDQPVPRGTYSIWAIPGAELWTIILSRAARVFHEPYPVGKDALRVSVRPGKGPHMETLGFYFPMVDADSALLYLQWGETVIPLHLRAQPRDAR
ncbi:MAG: DUF2911 domain-containing protein [Gemmatimonadota bacterium]|nr:DUF2911 domain-containing protein [Gemmatimonadota bacterium]